MQIKLISPQMTLRPMDGEFKRRMAPSLSLMVLGALTPSGHQVTLEDGNGSSHRFDDAPDLVGITVTVDTSLQAYRLAEHYRRRRIPVVLGGIHASANPQEALRHADAVCIGPAERMWARILDDVRRRQLQRCYQDALPPDPSLTPLPRWDLIDSARYLYTCILCASRGCPHRCDFCYNSSPYVRGGYQPRPIADVLLEIERLGTRQVMFIDDNFMGDVGWTRQMVEALKPLKLRWHAAVSTTIGNHPDLLDAMRDAGCESLFIGFESIRHGSIRCANKHQNHVDRYTHTLDAIHQRGIMVNASLAFGFDHDDVNVFRDTLDWLIAYKVETMTAHILTPYPGTRLHNQLESQGRIVDRNPLHYNTSYAVFTPRHMTRRQLREGYLWMYDQFYSWRNIWRRLPNACEQRMPYLLFNLIYRKYGRFAAGLAQFGFMRKLGKLARKLSYGID